MAGSGSSGGGREILVVGTGLTGAGLALLAARAGDAVSIVSVDRPGSRATSLASGVVHGIGPAGDPHDWIELPPEAHAAAAERAERGYQLLQEVLLSAPRSCGFARLPHQMHVPISSEGTWIEAVLTRLRAAGWPAELRDTRAGPRLVRPLDAIVHPRRVVYELLGAARAMGARLRFGIALRSIESGRDGRVVVRMGGEMASFDRVFWAAGQSLGRPDWEPPGRARLVLHQQLGRGRELLTTILESGDGNLVFCPDPLRPGHTVLTRIGVESPGGGLSWPAIPPEWETYRGPAVRQRLAEAYFSPTGPPCRTRSGVVRMLGLAGWSVAAVLGACVEAFDNPT